MDSLEPGLVHEDELWTPQVLTTAQKVTVMILVFMLPATGRIDYDGDGSGRQLLPFN
ncbi:MAG: hypothetical protein ACLRTD_24825 [Bacteroides sp.]